MFVNKDNMAAVAPKNIKTITLSLPEPDRVGKWEVFKENAYTLVTSKKFLVAMVVLGVVGLILTGIGVTGYFAHMKMLPEALTKLNVLGAMGNSAVAAIVVGGVMTLVGIAALIALIKRSCEEKRQKAAAIDALNNEFLLDQTPGYKELPRTLKAYAGVIEIDQYVKVFLNGLTTILYRDAKGFQVIPDLAEDDLKSLKLDKLEEVPVPQ